DRPVDRDPQRAELLELLLGCSLTHAVQILDPPAEGTSGLTRPQEGEHAGAHVPDVQVPAGRGGEASSGFEHGPQPNGSAPQEVRSLSSMGPLIAPAPDRAYKGGVREPAATPSAADQDAFTPEQRRILAVALIVAFLSLLSVSIVNVVLPSIESSLEATSTALQWVLTGYALAFGVVRSEERRVGRGCG